MYRNPLYRRRRIQNVRHVQFLILTMISSETSLVLLRVEAAVSMRVAQVREALSSLLSFSRWAIGACALFDEVPGPLKLDRSPLTHRT